VQRNDSANNTGYVGGSSSLTQVPPADRKPAPIVSGPQLGSKNKILSTADYAGKVIVVNVWGSWCAPCRKEAPDLAAASKRTAGTAAFVGIDIRDPDPAPAEAFARVFEVPYPSIYDPDGRQLVKFAGDPPPAAIPSTLIIDKQGRIAVRIIGIISEKTLVTVINDVAQGR
jgi:thiol-disulfide isomerase/thioredoxin